MIFADKVILVLVFVIIFKRFSKPDKIEKLPNWIK